MNSEQAMREREREGRKRSLKIVVINGQVEGGLYLKELLEALVLHFEHFHSLLVLVGGRVVQLHRLTHHLGHLGYLVDLVLQGLVERRLVEVLGELLLLLELDQLQHLLAILGHDELEHTLVLFERLLQVLVLLLQ